MITFNFSIGWPWPKSFKDGNTDYIEFDKKITKHKAFGFQFTKSCNFHTIFGITLDTQWMGQDHGGIRLTIELWRYFLHIEFYDMRHWNWEKKRWYTDEELEKEWSKDNN